MLKQVGFHFLLLAAGEILKTDDVVTPQKIQDFIVQDVAFGIRVPLDDCKLALRLLNDSNFITRIEKDQYRSKLTTFLRAI